MARYTGATCKLCRREGMKLFLKGDRCYTDKCAFVRRSYAPGQHGASRKKLSNYGTQLREKQKKLREYTEFLKVSSETHMKELKKMRGIAGENLLKLLEMRLDNVVYRLGYGASRTEARQLVNHGHFLVNGKKKSDIASFKVSVNDVITVCEKSRGSERFKMFAENPKALPKWLEANVENFEGKSCC